MPFPSCAVTLTWKPTPAVFAAAESGVVPPDIVTKNLLVAPAVKATVARFAMGDPLSVAVTVSVPVIVPDVSVAE